MSNLTAAKIILFFVGLAFSILLGLLITLPVMWLWNFSAVAAMPSVCAHIGFWQAFGLSALCTLLFRSSPSVSSK